MTKKIADMRISYDQDRLYRHDLNDNPFTQFQLWLDDATAADILEPNAMTLATCTADSVPSARMVLLKGIDHGFCFYTNYDSQKAKEIADNPHVALLFYWDVLYRSVRIVGKAEKVSTAESAAYYHSRPRGSQIGAWASPQSQPLANRAALEESMVAAEKRFSDVETIPLPPHWGGFRVIPTMVEFWQGQRSRLHDRIRYTKLGQSWKRERIAP